MSETVGQRNWNQFWRASIAATASGTGVIEAISSVENGESFWIESDSIRGNSFSGIFIDETLDAINRRERGCVDLGSRFSLQRHKSKAKDTTGAEWVFIARRRPRQSLEVHSTWINIHGEIATFKRDGSVYRGSRYPLFKISKKWIQQVGDIVSPFGYACEGSLDEGLFVPRPEAALTLFAEEGEQFKIIAIEGFYTVISNHNNEFINRIHRINLKFIRRPSVAGNTE